MVRGRRGLASLIGFIEVLIFIYVLRLVMSGLGQWQNMIMYAAGFAGGSYLGGVFEDRLALGYASIQVISHNGEDSGQLVDALRGAGYGVTVLAGYGREGPRDVINVTLPRKRLRQGINIVRKTSPSAFYTVLETRAAHGGVFPAGRK